MKATVKFQKPDGFGVVVFGNKTELTFLDKKNTYKKGEAVIAAPAYYRGKLCCKVAKFDAPLYSSSLLAKEWQGWGHARLNFGEYEIENGYPVYDCTETIEMKDLTVSDFRTERKVNKFYPEGEPETFCDIITKDGRKYSLMVFYSADFHNKKDYALGKLVHHNIKFHNEYSIPKVIKSIETHIKYWGDEENPSDDFHLRQLLAYRLELIGFYVYNKVFENYPIFEEEDIDAAFVEFAKRTVQLCTRQYSINHDQEKVENLHKGKEFMRSLGFSPQDH